MGGLFGVISKRSCVFDLFFGIDYHSHLGTKKGGMVVYGEKGFNRAIHNISNSPFRTKFERDVVEMEGNSGIGCISDNEPQPLIVRSHLGNFAITTVGYIENMDELLEMTYSNGTPHFLEMSGGNINQTEMVAAIINHEQTIVDGIKNVQKLIKGSMSILILTADGMYAARDRLGRTPIIIGKNDDGFCASFESFAYVNLGYSDYKNLGPGEIVYITPDSVETVSPALEDMKICSFLWVYYGYPTSCYEGINVENMRYRCGRKLAERDDVTPDVVAGIPDSGIAHAIGYANQSGVQYARPFIKYTPTWSRSFMPQNQKERNDVAKMKLIPVNELIKDKRLLLIDDSIVRGTQLRETAEFLYNSGAKEVHIRPACPPILFGCKYLNFSRSKSELDLIARRVIREREGDNVSDEVLKDYANPESQNYKEMLEQICKELKFTSLKFHRLDDMIETIGLPECKLCTYCWNGKE